MNVMGQLKLLSQDQMQEIHERACRILEEKGIVFETDSAVERFRKAGCKVDDHTVYIPKKLIEQSLAQTPSSYHIVAPNKARSLDIGGTNIAIHPAGGCPFVSDYRGLPREATRQDFINFQKLYQWSENVDISGYQPVSPNDVSPRTKNLYMAFDSFNNSDKPILAPMELETNQMREELFKLYEIAYGGKDFIENNYVTWCCACPNSPLFYAAFPCDTIEVFAAHNQPVLIVSAPMSGITSPVYLLSTIILTVAESLAGLVLAQLVRPGVPVIMSASLTYGYLRYGSWAPSSPDSSTMLAAMVQMNRDFYNLPARAQTGCTSSKLNDFQAGMETIQSFLWCALAGVNITSQTSGSLADLMSSSLEKIVLDDELISRVRWMVKGLEFNEEQMGWDDIMECKPLDNFMMNDSTVDECMNFWQPTVSDWNNVDQWKASGAKDAETIAHEKVEQVLEEAPDSVLDPEVQKEMLDFIAYVERNQ